MFAHSAWKTAAAAALLTVSGAVTAAGVDLGNATLLAGPTYSKYLGGVDQTLPNTVDLAKIAVTSTPGEASFTYDPGVTDFYSGGYHPNNGLFNIKGNLSNLTFLGNLVAQDGYVVNREQDGYRITGEVTLTDQATVTLWSGGGAQTFTGKGEPSASDTFTFTADTKLGGNSGPILSWSGGTPSVSSAATIKITKVEYHVPVVAVPESSSLSLMALGLLGLTFARRRQLSATTA